MKRLKGGRQQRVISAKSVRQDLEIVEFIKRSDAQCDYDAVCVLGGGYGSDGSLPPWVHHRLDLSYHLHSLQPLSCPIVCVGGGTPHKPPVLTSTGYTLHESTLLAMELIKKGISSERILKETSSYDTVGNAYFTLTIHAIPAKWTKIAIVTSKFHMARASTLFTDIFNLASSQYSISIHLSHWWLSFDPCRFMLEFFAAEDDHTLSQKVLDMRREREKLSLMTWKKDLDKLKSLQDVHRWLYHTHLCYSVSRQDEFGKPTTDMHPTTINSY